MITVKMNIFFKSSVFYVSTYELFSNYYLMKVSNYGDNIQIYRLDDVQIHFQP